MQNKTIDHQGPGKPRPVSLGDLATAATLAVCLPIAWLLPVSGLKACSRGLARLHAALRGDRTGDLLDHPVVAQIEGGRTALQRDFLATVYEETCYTLREHRRGGWRPAITLHGREHIDAALAAGGGAILWISPCSYAELVVKKACSEATLPLVNLRSHIHPYSGTRLGRRWLNPIRTRVEDRYLRDSVVLYPGREAVALRQLQLWLRRNTVVSIFAIASADQPRSVPCLSGSLRLAMGAPALARLSGAPLLPVYTCETSPGAFTVTVGPPLQPAIADTAADEAADLAVAFADFTASEVMKCPRVWRGWLTRALWQPDVDGIDRQARDAPRRGDGMSAEAGR